MFIHRDLAGQRHRDPIAAAETSRLAPPPAASARHGRACDAPLTQRHSQPAEAPRAAGTRQTTRQDLAHPAKETTMRAAILYYYLVQTRAAEPHRHADREAQARAASRARHPQRARRSHRARGLSAVVARRMRAVRGGSP